MNQSSNFLGGSFGSRDNVRAPIEFRKKVYPSITKDYFSSGTDSSIFTSRAPVLLDQSNKTSIEINKSFPCPTPQCLVDQIQVQKPILLVATDQMPDDTD